MTKFPDLFEKLAAPFPENELRTRNQGGRTLTYIQAHTVMDRLDDVLGPENWWTEIIPTGTVAGTSWLCKLSIRLPDGTVLTKQDVGANAGMTVNGQLDTENDDKSGASDAIKRAAVHFGIARYLRYGGGSPSYQGQGSHQGQRGGSWGNPPPAPASRPQGHREAHHADERPRQGGGYDNTQAPRSGRALFARVKDLEANGYEGLLSHANRWAKLREFPGRMVDFDADQTAEAWAEIQRKMSQAQQPVPAGGDEIEEEEDSIPF